MDVKQLFMISRPWSFPMTVISVSLGAALALYVGPQVDVPAYILSLVGAVVLHAATNIINDYFDVVYGVDVPGAPTTRYRPHPMYVMRGEEARALLILPVGMYVSAFLIISPIVFLASRTHLVLYWVVGVLLSYMYTGPPFKMKYRAMGELMVFLVWGPLMVSGSFYAVSGVFNPVVVVASIPVGLLVSSVLLANNIRDIEYDSSTGIETIPIKIGYERSVKLYSVMLTLPYVVVAVLSVMLTYTLLLTYASAPLAARLVRVVSTKVPDKADPMTAQLTLVFGLLYITGVVMGYVV